MNGHGGIWKLACGIRKLESGIRKLESGIFRNWYSETRNPVFGNWELSCIPKLENDIRKLGIVFGNYFSETGTLELGNFRDTTAAVNLPPSAELYNGDPS